MSESPAPTPRAPYVREMRPEELHAATIVCTRAFATNRFQRWIGSIPRGSGYALPPRDTTLKGLKAQPRPTRTLYHFQAGLIRTMLLTGGRVLVVVQPKEDGTEEIVAVALWNRPGAEIDSPGVLLRAKMHRAVLGDAWHPFGGWNIGGLRRALGAQAQYVKCHVNALKENGYTHRDAWTLEILGTDPDEEGKGHAGKLMREGLAFIGNKPCLLEVPSPQVKKIYEHYGFVETAVLTFGKGRVDEQGLRCSKTDTALATGFPVWPMLHLPKA
ncbi:hypothetical protein EXIGLDRAFT_728707 [Exidia glandulosa HHB12029]|uniref:N-acetyltransferase domain-containing protein n=1 Tax=Exidia glandulosa HHB12029 TaxID=1314781 RepID=A0A165LS26_EXIGL|nr:hypothetical protein EXIGLDRAFT_728707 [Exidia glandulosa HHB12029]